MDAGFIPLFKVQYKMVQIKGLYLQNQSNNKGKCKLILVQGGDGLWVGTTLFYGGGWCKVPRSHTHYPQLLFNSPLLLSLLLILVMSLIPTTNTWPAYNSLQLTYLVLLPHTTAHILDTTLVDRPVSRFSSDVYTQGQFHLLYSSLSSSTHFLFTTLHSSPYFTLL